VSSHRATREEVEAFVQRFDASAFPHATEVLEMLREQDSALRLNVQDGRLGAEVRAGYRRRAEGLASRTLPPQYPATLPHDVRALADVLEREPDQDLRIWDLRHRDGRVYLLFELVDAGRLAGAVRTVDRRIVDPEWRALGLRMGAKPFDFDDPDV
jgi:hypothetical protein